MLGLTVDAVGAQAAPRAPYTLSAPLARTSRVPRLVVVFSVSLAGLPLRGLCPLRVLLPAVDVTGSLSGSRSRLSPWC